MNKDEFEQKFEAGAKAAWLWSTTHTIVVTHLLAFAAGFVVRSLFA